MVKHMISKGFAGILSAVLSVALLVSTGSSLHAQSRQTTPMTDNSYSFQIGFRPYGTMLIAVMVRDIGGKTAVCGFWTAKERFQAYITAHGVDRRARQTSTISVGSVRLLTGIDFMNKVSPEDFRVGTQARCKVTSVPWQAGFARQKVGFKNVKLTIRS